MVISWGSFLGLSGSYSWRSIWGAKALMKEGLIWRVGNGTSIDIWKDPWIADKGGRFIVSDNNSSLKFVHELINVESNEWNFELVNNHFNERDVNCIMAIPLSD
ncbi:hypothetical protein POM88_054007 [Heracleum sosnowskyi]|uniref:Uncharacterized protein n=1 Tax=Heracleum sosnowskyi TaxID=360622 RepID=A0AAD8LXD1_9APIA|nr:hypothetical protein POM88_054007 [Heracleum sosnowskyi]